jgi:DNA-binding NarL/FixJ family response regulator
MKRILIIDDHEVVRRGLKDILGEALPGAIVGEAGSSRAAAEHLVQATWDLVLLDLHLPGRSGLELLTDIRREHPNLPVLVLSAFAEEDYAVQAIRLGASGYLTKESASDELRAAVNKALAGGKYVTATLAERLARTLGGQLDQKPHEALSPRELQVLCLIAQGKTLKEIAADLGLSEKTVGTYRTRISDKTGLRTNVELARYAIQHQLVR